jgi:hypothetical protein
MKEVVATIRPRPVIVIPNEKNLFKVWERAKYTFENKKLTRLEKLLSIFVVRKELVHPSDFRIFYCMSVRGKVFRIGRLTNGCFIDCSSFEELEKLNACRYIR